MRGWFVSQVVLLIGALGMTGAARAQDYGSRSFTSKAQAEAYLRSNPTGPRAKAAFLAIVEFDLARENPGFSRSDIARGVNLRAPTRAPVPVRTQSPPANNTRSDDGDLY